MELKTSAEVERPLRLPLPRPYPRLLPLPLPRSLSLLGKLQLAAGMTTSAEEHLAKPKRKGESLVRQGLHLSRVMGSEAKADHGSLRVHNYVELNILRRRRKSDYCDTVQYYSY